MRRIQILASISGLALAAAVHAQTAPSAPADAPVVDLATPSAAVNVAPQPGAAAPANGLEEIVVTANRRASTLKDVPSSISAYGGAKLAAEQIVNLNDLAAISPNIQIGRSEGANANITIRGIGNTQFAAGSDPGVAFHVDGVYFAQTGLTASTLLDIDRVEVLRGPQGTLFGRNTTGGAINVLPNVPTSELHYGFDGSYAVDPWQARSAGFVSGPLTGDGTLLGRIAVQQTYNDGFTRNLVATGPRRLDTQNQSVRAQLEWKPTDRLTNRLSFEYAHENDSGPAAFRIGTPDPTQPLPVQIQGAPASNEANR